MRRGPIPRGAFDATLEIARSAVEFSPYYDAGGRRAALHIIKAIEDGVLRIARLAPAQVGRNAERQDPQGLGPKDEHAVAEGDAPKSEVSPK